MATASRRSGHKITSRLLRHAYVTKNVRGGVAGALVSDDTGHTVDTMNRYYVDADPRPDADRSRRALDGIANRVAPSARPGGHLRAV
jgi:integrase